LSHLSVWWLRLGIKLERIKPGKPQQNGRHERMHRTLKKDVMVCASQAARQREFDRFRYEYNWRRSPESAAFRSRWARSFWDEGGRWPCGLTREHEALGV
jgi:transposase InsO family protein